MHGVLVVDKAVGPTSHDVVRAARRALGTRAVGHAGTLDPMASGVLVLGVGEGTKLLQYLTGADKAYRAEVRLGAQTDTLDAQGRVIATQAVPARLDVAQVRAAAAQFLGTTQQRAPEISAIKQSGTPLYALVRRGEHVEAPHREVQVHELVIESVAAATIALRVRCGKGFYVRALARDLAEALGTLGHLTALRRTASGGIELDAALAFDTLRAAAHGDRDAQALCRKRVLPLETAVSEYPRACLTPEGVEDARHGRLIRGASVLGAPPPCGAEPVAVLDGRGTLVALGRCGADGIRVLRGFPPRG